MSSDNPFERFDLDPFEGPAGITERMRDIAQDAKDEAERDEVRTAWRELTQDPRRRLALALSAHPDTRVLPGKRPERPASEPARLMLRALVVLPSIHEALGVGPGLPVLPCDEDPILNARSERRKTKKEPH